MVQAAQRGRVLLSLDGMTGKWKTDKGYIHEKVQ